MKAFLTKHNSQLSVNDSSRNDFLHTELAPSYGKLTGESIQAMDDELKIMIAGTMKTIANIQPENRSWDNIKSALLQNPVIEADGDPVFKADSLNKEGTNVFKTDGSPDDGIVQEVSSSIEELLVTALC